MRLTIAVAPELVDLVVHRVAEMVSERLEEPGTTGRYLTVLEAAEYLRWSRHRLYKLTAASAIPLIRHQGRILFDRVALDRWLEDFREG